LKLSGSTQPRRQTWRIPLADCYLEPVAQGELPDSHPGASAVADVTDADGTFMFTAASVYGQWEMMPGGMQMDAGPRLHRIISDLAGILANARRYPLILAGDLNITTQYPDRPTQRAKDAAAAASAAFARLNAFGLQDCLIHQPVRPHQIASCRCLDGDQCRHTRTFRSRNLEESAPAQLDYVFASDSVVTSVKTCYVDQSADAWALSDHAPVVLEFDEQPLREAARHAG
jgi:endonuclease/exonuclease/phosphatase (EEP) superfamily protein YafD